MIVLLDMDGVIADLEKNFLLRWRQKYPDEIYIPLEQRNTYYIVDQYPREYSDAIRKIFAEPGFFLSLEPIEGSIQAIKELCEIGVDMFICTTPLDEYKNCVLEKYEWIDKYLGFTWTTKLVLTTDKTIIKGDILIDDRPVIKGVEVPTWEHIIYDLPKNRSEKNKRRLSWKNWKNIIFP